MATASEPAAPGWFRLVSSAGLIWSLVGLLMLLMHLGLLGDTSPSLSDAQRTLEAGTPAWVLGAMTIATVSAVLGSLGLVRLKAEARPQLYLALGAVLVQQAWTIFVSDAVQVYGILGWVLPVIIIAIATLLVGLGNMGVKRGWLH